MHSVDTLFIQLAIVLGLSALFGYVVRLLKLPLLVAYLIAGVVLSASALFDLHTSEVLTLLPEIGIAFVLFFIGMELDFKEIKALGKPIVAAGLGQIIISALAGYAIAGFFGLPNIEALFLGVGLSVSSTIVVIKLLLEKKDLSSLYGKLALGILLLEDLVSVGILMALTLGSSFLGLGLQNSLPILSLIAKGVLLFLMAAILSRYILTKLFQAVAKSAELLFLTALSWCFIFVALSLMLGFSVVIGAFLAGLALANSPFHFEIQGKVKPLRDFFVTLFFVYLGSQVVFQDLDKVIPLMVAFTLFALIIKPIIFLLILGVFGFKKHTIFHTAVSLSQVSEFSLIIMVVGLNMGMVSQTALTAMALTGVVSIILSSIMISSSKHIYKFFSPYLVFFEHSKLVHSFEGRGQDLVPEKDHVVLIGSHRLGGVITHFLQKEKIPLIVLDFNPKVIQRLQERGVNAIYGDISDPEILDLLRLESAKLIISTADDTDDNLIFLSELRKRKVNAAIIMRALNPDEARLLYNAGADFVILPEMIAGEYILSTLKSHWPKIDVFRDRSELELDKISRHHLSNI